MARKKKPISVKKTLREIREAPEEDLSKKDPPKIKQKKSFSLKPLINKLYHSKILRGVAILGIVAIGLRTIGPPLYAGASNIWDSYQESRLEKQLQTYKDDFSRVQNLVLTGKYLEADDLSERLQANLAKETDNRFTVLFNQVIVYDDDVIDFKIEKILEEQRLAVSLTQTAQAIPTSTPFPTFTPYPTSTLSPTTIPTLETLILPDFEIENFEVVSHVPKNPTGIRVAQGDVMHFEYMEGLWTGEGGTPKVMGCGYYFNDPVTSHVWLMPPEHRGAALIGYIKNEPFFIGCQPVDIVAGASGDLYLGMSDCLDCFWDNEGALYVDISVHSNPNTRNIVVSGPFREHHETTIGTGVFSNVTYSDGMLPYTEDDLWALGHFDIQRIRPEEQPSGCDISEYNTNKIWFGSAEAVDLTINGTVVGTLYQGNPSHGYMVDVQVNSGDEICVSRVAPGGYHIYLGPDIYYHHDSYCYRGHCD